MALNEGNQSINNSDETPRHQYTDTKKDETSSNAQDRDVETTDKKVRYPYQIFLIFGNEAIERFSYYGMRAILLIYLYSTVGFEQNTAITISQASTMLSQFFPVIGGMIADAWLGKYWTIVWFSIIYGLGDVLQALAATPSLNLPIKTVCLIGLAFTAVGSGGIKPCVSALGADQFILPQQEKQLASYFGIFYLTINLGSLLSTFIVPEISKLQCFGEERCYSLAFGIPAALMVLSTIIFLIGTPWYRKVPVEENVVWRVAKTVKYALSKKWKSNEKRTHWLDHADEKYKTNDIADIKTVLKVMVLYIPLPIYWAVYGHGASRWSFQAMNMDGRLGSIRMLPEQTAVINSVLIFTLLPLFNRYLYPFLGKHNILKNHLHRLILGGVFAGLAFVASIVLELQLENNYALTFKNDESSLNFINMAPMGFQAQLRRIDNDMDEMSFDIPKDLNHLTGIVASGRYQLQLNDYSFPSSNYSFSIASGDACSILITKMSGSDQIQFVDPCSSCPGMTSDTLEKSMDMKAIVRIIQAGLWENPQEGEDEIIQKNLNTTVLLEGKVSIEFGFMDPLFQSEADPLEKYPDWQSTQAVEVDPYKYEILIKTNGTEVANLGSVELNQGGSYVLAVVKDGVNYKQTLNIVTHYDDVSILWMIPQFFLMSVSEILFAVTLIEFSYMEAPKNMKSVMQAIWMTTSAIGSLIVILVVEGDFFDRQWKEYLLCTFLIFGDMILLYFLSRGYKSVRSESGSGEAVPAKNDNKRDKTDKTK